MSRAWLPETIAIVKVGPPLFCSPAGSRPAMAPGFEPFAADRPHVLSSSRFWPRSVIVPEQEPPARAFAKRVFRSLALGLKLAACRILPPCGAELPDSVT